MRRVAQKTEPQLGRKHEPQGKVAARPTIAGPAESGPEEKKMSAWRRCSMWSEPARYELVATSGEPTRHGRRRPWKTMFPTDAQGIARGRGDRFEQRPRQYKQSGLATGPHNSPHQLGGKTVL